MSDGNQEIREAVRAEMAVLVQHLKDTMGGYSGMTYERWLNDGMDWYLESVEPK